MLKQRSSRQIKNTISIFMKSRDDSDKIKFSPVFITDTKNRGCVEVM